MAVLGVAAQVVVALGVAREAVQEAAVPEEVALEVVQEAAAQVAALEAAVLEAVQVAAQVEVAPHLESDILLCCLLGRRLYRSIGR